jgi:hypothetical protein
MRLESARDLKASLAAKFVPSPRTQGGIESIPIIGDEERPAIAAQRVVSLQGPQPSLAIGVAERRTGDYRLAVRVQRRSPGIDARVEAIVQEARGEAEMVYVGQVAKRTTLMRAVPWHQARVRPVRPGCSIGHYQVTAGTVGAIVADGSGARFVLSNNHVLADENRAAIGDPILQPGALDRGEAPPERVASLTRAIPLDTDTVNVVDAAIARIDSDVDHDGTLEGIGAIQHVYGDVPTPGMPVRKLGRTTGHTTGRITAFELDNVVVSYELGHMRFDGVIEIDGDRNLPFSDAGDSGSVIVTTASVAGVGLVFAGTDQGGRNGRGLTFANSLSLVLDRMGVVLA